MPTPGYQTQQQPIAVAGVADLAIRSLLDRQQFHDPLGTAARSGISSAAWPMFGLPWPSGALLAARLALRPVREGERILEIGCGLALASLVAHRCGADVTASDCHPLAETFLLENLRLNGLLPMKYRHVDWAAPPPAATPGGFDLVIGSDVLYERDDGGLLAACIGAQAAPSAEVWIVDPDRANRPAFTRRMARLGFELRQERIDRAAMTGRPAYKGRILIFTRPPP
jgi:predicted nicotinamide N-methyase